MRHRGGIAIRRRSARTRPKRRRARRKRACTRRKRLLRRAPDGGQARGVDPVPGQKRRRRPRIPGRRRIKLGKFGTTGHKREAEKDDGAHVPPGSDHAGRVGTILYILVAKKMTSPMIMRI